MLRDADARLLFVDAAAAALVPADMKPRCIALDSGAPGTPFDDWLAAPGTEPLPVAVKPESPFNLIYSSGTTGTPKGIVQPHLMRWMHTLRGAPYGYGPDAVTVLATPLYSNTTLVAFFPALGLGGTVVLMAKFDAADFLALAERHRATHTMLVPVQYQRIMALPDFGRHDLSSFRMKFCDQRAVFRSVESRRAGALARRADRVLWHDRRRRHLHPRSAPPSRQVAYRRPAGRRS